VRVEEGRGTLFIGEAGQRAGVWRWRRPTTARGLASSRGAVMTSGCWRQRGGESRGRAWLRGRGEESRRRARLASARVRGNVSRACTTARVLVGCVAGLGPSWRGRREAQVGCGAATWVGQRGEVVCVLMCRPHMRGGMGSQALGHVQERRKESGRRGGSVPLGFEKREEKEGYQMGGVTWPRP
jgi:hypothetical protein